MRFFFYGLSVMFFILALGVGNAWLLIPCILFSVTFLLMEPRD